MNHCKVIPLDQRVLIAYKIKEGCLQVMHLYKVTPHLLTVTHSSSLFVAVAQLCDVKYLSTMHHMEGI